MNLILNSPFNLIVSLNSLEKMERLVKAIKQGANLFEIRVDLLTSNEIDQLENWFNQADEKKIPILLTIRKWQQGGNFVGSEIERFKQIKKLLQYKAIVAIDIEQNSTITQEVISLAKKNNKLTLCSTHFFATCPTMEKMNKLLTDGKKINSDIFKLAVNLANLKEYQRVSQFLLTHSKNHSLSKKMIVVGMGKLSLLSRLTFPALGSLASYCHISKQTAPNQPSFKELRKLKSICYSC